MKALSLNQPWASLVAVGAKRIETRNWYTSYRGPLAIHATKGFPNGCKALCDVEPFKRCLRKAKLTAETLPLGEIVAVATIDQCWLVRRGDLLRISDTERAFGNYEGGRYAWFLKDIKPLPRPIPATGALGLWWVPTHVELEIERMLKEAS
ncbi:MAG: ASCH domain-containing protein [Dehalococcoidales bacterium]|nr:ASCH domain-containing protein [Dehalococcoidales bacterium]